MRFEELDGILFGTISVIMPERGYIISFDDPSHAIEACQLPGIEIPGLWEESYHDLTIMSL